MLQHFVEFSLCSKTSDVMGIHFITKTEICSLNNRDLGEVWLIKPKETYAFRLFNQNVVECEDGEVIFGKKKEWSGYYYYGQGPFSREKILEADQNNRYRDKLQFLKRMHDYNELDKIWNRNVWGQDAEPEEFPDAFVIAINGEIYPLYTNDCVIICKTEL